MNNYAEGNPSSAEGVVMRATLCYLAAQYFDRGQFHSRYS